MKRALIGRELCMQQNEYGSDSHDFLRHKYPPAVPPALCLSLSSAIDKKHFHEKNTNMLFYLWLSDYREFWFFPLAFTRAYVRGYVWNGKQWTDGYLKEEMIYAFF